MLHQTELSLRATLETITAPEQINRQRDELGLTDDELQLAKTILQTLEHGWRDRVAAAGEDIGQSATTKPTGDLFSLSFIGDYFRHLADGELTQQNIAQQLQHWIGAAESGGVTNRDYLLASHRFLALLLAEVKRASPQHLADAQRIFSKLSFLHAGLVSDAISAYHQHASSYRALHDMETGLPNHALFMDELRRSMQANRDTGNLIALLTLDLHYFNPQSADSEANLKPYAVAAEHLRGALREEDMLARLSNKEFGFILPGIASEGHAILAANKFLRTLENQLNLGDIAAHIRPRVGIALYPDHAQHAESLVQFATVARREAETSDIGYAIYSAEFDKSAMQTRSLEAGLKNALRENELMLYFQPQCDAASGAVIGAEALLRWHRNNNEWVPPNLIVEVAENTGLISQLTMWVINSALRIRAGFMKSGIDLIVSVNLSAANLLENELPAFVEQALRTWGVPASSLMLEITESAMITDAKTSLDILHRLKALGVSLSIDDFGTGYSSMAYLKQMPLNELKIDQTFVRKLTSMRDDQRIVRSMIDLAHNFELNVVAEGVEDKPTMDMLQTMGCDIIQGYYLAKPLPEADFIKWCFARAETLQKAALTQKSISI
ncbi:MAG: GGDEF domain-containing phosphodiesterase [Burkholderiales bacterium]